MSDPPLKTLSETGVNKLAFSPDFPKPPLFGIVSQSPDLLVINKPAGLVCHPTKTDALSSLISRIRLYLNTDQSVHLINRLDRETTPNAFCRPSAWGWRRERVGRSRSAVPRG